MSFRPIFDNYLLVGLLTLGLLGLLLVRPPFERAVSNRGRRILVALRAAVFGCVILAMLRPTVVHTQVRVEPANLVILADDSRSMSVTDEGERSRWQAISHAVETAWPVLKPFRDLLRPEVYRFAARAERLEATPDGVPFAKEATGEQTDIVGALEDVLKEQGANQLAAVVLLSDGAQRATLPRPDLQEPARELARRGVPLYTVAVGRGREQSQARDVAVENLPDQYAVFVDNELKVQAAIRIQGYADRAIPVELIIEGPGGPAKRMGPEMVRAPVDDEFVDVQFRLIPDQPGEYRLIVRATPQPDEPVTENNELGAFLNVLEGGVRVLYLDGNPAWQEQKFLRRAIEASPDVDLDYVWVDVRARTRWPIDLKGLMAKQRYDVLVLGDVHATALGLEQSKWIADRVDQGLGLMMLGGARSFGSGGYAAPGPLSRVLPVDMSPFARRDPQAGLDPQQQVSSDLRAKPTEDHFITSLGGEGIEPWSGLPPLRGANVLKPTDTGRVILEGYPVGAKEAGSGEPLLIATEYGGGRVLAFGVDSTYRWYRSGFQREHLRFWRQCMLWLAHKDVTKEGDVWVQLPQRRLPSGARLRIQAGARNARGEAITDAEFQVEIEYLGDESPVAAREEQTDKVPSNVGTQPSGSTAPRQSVEGRWENEEWSGNSDAFQRSGAYRVLVRATRGGRVLGTASAGFLVTQQDLELSDPAANPRQLALLASITKEAGGKVVAPEQLASLFEELAQRRQEQRIEYEDRWQLGDTALDAWLSFLAVVGLLSTEWYLRKKWSLV